MVSKVIGHHHPQNSKRSSHPKKHKLEPSGLPQAGVKVWADIDIVHGPLGGALAVHDSQEIIKDRMTRKGILATDDINEVQVVPVKQAQSTQSHYINF